MHIENGAAKETCFLKTDEKLIRYIRASNAISVCLGLLREIKRDQCNEDKVKANHYKTSNC